MIFFQQHSRRAAVAAVAVAAALGVAGCGAGQISQTADQVAAIDGASGTSENGLVTVNDVSLVLAQTPDETSPSSSSTTAAEVSGTPETSTAATQPGQAYVAFTVAVESKPSSHDTTRNKVKVTSIDVNGTSVDVTSLPTVEADHTLIASAPADEYAKQPSPTAGSPAGSVTYVTPPTITLPKGVTSGSSMPVTFTFSDGSVIRLDAAVTVNQPTGGTYTRNSSTEVTEQESHHSHH